MPLRVFPSGFLRRTRLPRSVFAGLCLFAGSICASAQDVPIVSPRYGAPIAPSAITVRLLAVARPTIAVLERASAMAAERASAKRLRGFARRENQILPAIAEALDGAAAPTSVGGDPLDSAAVAAASVDEGTETILSVLPPILRTPGARAVAVDRDIALRGAADLARLATLTGADFDSSYVAISRDALDRLVAIFRDYAQNGDEQSLRATSVHALPGLRGQFGAISRHSDRRESDG